MSKIKYVFIFIFIISLQSTRAQEDAKVLTGNKITIDGETFYLYKVQPKEGLYRISQKFGVTQQDILSANPEAHVGLKIDQLLKIPVIRGRNSNSAELEKSNTYIYHKVEKGQTLFFVSRQYGVTEDEIISINPGSERGLKIGYDLRIPIKKSVSTEDIKSHKNSIYHEVKPQETLYFLSVEYKVPIADIVAANPGLESGIIQVGTTLRIPAQVVNTSNNNTSITTPNANSENNLEDEQYIYHKLKAGETLFGLGKQYNISVDKLQSVNNIVDVSGIKTGYIIRIPKELSIYNGTITDGSLIAQKPIPDYSIHKTGKNESLRFLAEKYKVNANDIVALNPNIKKRKWTKLRKNTSVKIPIKKKKEAIKEEPTITDAEREKFIADSIWLAKSFAADCDSTALKGAVNIAYLGPFYLDKNDSINIEMEIDSLGIKRFTEKYPKEIYPQYNIFREFYFGSLVAVDSLKKLGISVNVFTYDVKRESKDNTSLKGVLSRPEMKDMHIIFGPAHGHQIPMVADFCKTHSIKMVLPFGQEHNVVQENPNVYCLNANETLLYPSVVSHIIKMNSDANLILITGNTKDKRQDAFSGQLREAVFTERLKSTTEMQYYEVNFDKDGIAGIENLVKNDKKSLVIIASEDKKLFNTILPSLYYLKTKKKFPIALFGFPEWMMATSSDLEYMFSLNTVVFNQYFVDYSDPLVLNVLQQYSYWFGSEPTVSHPSLGILHPNNGLLGFDATFYFVNGVKAFGTSFDKCNPSLDLELTESDFVFKRENIWSGFSNKLINFSDDYNLYMMGTEDK